MISNINNAFLVYEKYFWENENKQLFIRKKLSTLKKKAVEFLKLLTIK